MCACSVGIVRSGGRGGWQHVAFVCAARDVIGAGLHARSKSVPQGIAPSAYTERTEQGELVAKMRAHTVSPSGCIDRCQRGPGLGAMHQHAVRSPCRPAVGPTPVSHRPRNGLRLDADLLARLRRPTALTGHTGHTRPSTPSHSSRRSISEMSGVGVGESRAACMLWRNRQTHI